MKPPAGRRPAGGEASHRPRERTATGRPAKGEAAGPGESAATGRPGREGVSLPWPPADPAALRDFPRRTLGASQELWRLARRGRGPWWFGSSGAGRFDLPAPHGTCYLATDPLAALLEVLAPQRRGGLVAEELLAARRLWRLRLPEERSLADLTAPGAARWITLEIHTLTPYDRPRAWAARLHQAGAEGLRYLPRHDPGPHPPAPGVALFGPAGERKGPPHGRATAIPPTLRRRLHREHGIVVLPRPRRAELRIEKPK